MNPSFDKGPWRVAHAGGTVFVTEDKDLPKSVDDIYKTMLITIQGENAEANAHLARTAPDMYELLEEWLEQERFLQDERECDVHRRQANRIEKILKRANGEDTPGGGVEGDQLIQM